MHGEWGRRNKIWLHGPTHDSSHFRTSDMKSSRNVHRSQTYNLKVVRFYPQVPDEGKQLVSTG